MAQIKVGDTAPDFETKTDKNETVKLSNYRGKRVVLYFYPKDDTPGCTTQACGFRDIYGDVGEPTQSGGFHHFEVRRIDPDFALYERDNAQLLVELLVSYRLIVANDALVHALQVRAGERADPVTNCREQLGDHAGGGGLTVRAGEMDRRILELRRAEVLQELADAVERGGTALA